MALTLAELLDHFSTTELAEALFQKKLPTSGSKADRITRLHTVILESGMTSTAALDLFTAAALRIVCGSLDLPPGRKADMVHALAATLSDLAAPIVTPPPPVTYLDPSKDAVLACLREVKLIKRKIRSEVDFKEALLDWLAPKFRSVVDEYAVGGILNLRIDLDIGNGRVGIELKLSESIRNNTNEFHRFIGQAVYYSFRRYKDNLIVAVAGEREDAEDPLFEELFEVLTSVGITPVHVTLVPG
jgi:hypothetical protein